MKAGEEKLSTLEKIRKLRNNIDFNGVLPKKENKS